MADDPLAKFRKSPTVKPEATLPESKAGLPDYQAFDAKDKIKRLEIRRVMGAFHTPAYAYLLNVIFDGYHGTELVLVYSFMLVKVKGRNLHPITLAVQEGKCAFIQDYDPRAFAEPAPDAPFIESIEIIAKEGGDERG
ncbi:hypothetical protein SAMN02949497_4775 [Methylomagnum ishizawai]|uniref:Uncharacterized protein n=1 Tax=Methylomagnum ishizawai TaxID=1760988 RepID=A0A1Y6D5G2_9GAMM|nr:hypothetical protein [Methylomagnum ishizawai]SMF97899.1 hypothetical protein SAMN02949497_4755 [Methylomagnum ishizawai]SMF97917.1 hypothetical protein SAMN02949497_4775 [Methylomagnum ishizawai]